MGLGGLGNLGGGDTQLRQPQDQGGGGNATMQPQLPAFNTGGRLDSFYQTPLYAAMPEWAYMPVGLKQDNKEDADDQMYSKLATQQASNMRAWNNYLDKVHMEYLKSMVPNYETQSYDYTPTAELLAAYAAKPELRQLSG